MNKKDVFNNINNNLSKFELFKTSCYEGYFKYKNIKINIDCGFFMNLKYSLSYNNCVIALNRIEERRLKKVVKNLFKYRNNSLLKCLDEELRGGK